MVDYRTLAVKIAARILGADNSETVDFDYLANMIRQEVEGCNNTSTVDSAVIVDDPGLEEYYRNLPSFTQSIVVGNKTWQEFVG
jgi:hypothetical protein